MPVVLTTTVPAVSWTSWFPDPVVILGVLAATFCYLRLCRPWQTRFTASAPIPTARRVSFFAGLACAVLALLSPLEPLADDYLLSAHMVQHLLLTLAIPPLIYYGLPEWFYAACARSGRPWRVWRTLTQPVLAFAIFQLPFSLAHAPIFYDLTLRNQPVHIAEHLVFIGTAFVAWWPLLAPGRAYGQLTPGAQLLYLFAQTAPGQLVGALITIGDGVLYSKYAAAPRIWGLSPLADQQLGGLIMWIGTGTVYLGAMAYVFFRWAGGEDRAEKERYAALARKAQAAREEGVR
jgi:putative membrane protein